MFPAVRSRIGRPHRPPAGRQWWHLAGTAGIAVVAIAGLVLLAPAMVGLSTTSGMLELVSFRGIVALALVGAGLLWLPTLLLGRRRPGRPWRRWALGILLLALGLGQAGVVAARGWATPPTAGRADVVVISLNTRGGAATPADIAAVVLAESASAGEVVVALPETTERLAQRTAALLAAAGHHFQVFASPTAGRPLDSTSLLVGGDLGVYRQVPAPRLDLGAVVVEPVSGTGPTLGAVHAAPPVPVVEYRQWAGEVETAVRMCTAHPDAIIAGDFNSTVDHRMLRRLGSCVDAATRAGRGGEGTWPSNFPAALAAPIDHVILDGRTRVLGTRTLRVGSTDHRALIARLDLDQPG